MMKFDIEMSEQQAKNTQAIKQLCIIVDNETLGATSTTTAEDLSGAIFH